MSFAEKSRNFLTKLQNLPDNKKKIILWSIVAVLAIIMGFFWIREARNNFSKIGQSIGEVKLPEIDVSDMPIIDLQNIEDQIKQNSTPSK